MTPNTTSFRRRNLPHWHVKSKPYFVTFRLKGSLPESIVNRLKRDYQNFLDSDPNQEEILIFQRKRFKTVETILDSAKNSPTYLRIPEIAQIVLESFDWLETECHWRIPAAVIMPNHVHILLVDSELATKSLERSIGIMKGFTAREANKILNRKGQFWMPENFDHWCRSADKTESVKRYIRNNPVKAGLVKNPDDWRWLREGNSVIPG